MIIPDREEWNEPELLVPNNTVVTQSVEKMNDRSRADSNQLRIDLLVLHGGQTEISVIMACYGCSSFLLKVLKSNFDRDIR